MRPDPARRRSGIALGVAGLAFAAAGSAQDEGPPAPARLHARVTAISERDAPPPREGPTTVWTGHELIVWGGYDDLGDRFAFHGTGGRYEPRADRWRAMSDADAPAARAWHTAVWTGEEMIVWGGEAGDEMFGDGAAYDPERDRWRSIATEGAPPPRVEHAAVWTGREMLVFAGVQDEVSFASGGRYDPRADAWSPLAAAPFLRGARAFGAVWTGREMIVFGGINGGSTLRQGGRYDPVTDAWQPLSLDGAPSERGWPGMVWTGELAVVFGGSRGVFDGPPARGGAAYDPRSDRWTPLPETCLPAARTGHAMIWSGTALLVLGGGACDRWEHRPLRDVGAAWFPGETAWRSLALDGELPPCVHGRARWTGSEVLRVGGRTADTVHRGGVRIAFP